MPREELFVVSKVAAEHKNYESAAKSIDETLEKMGLDYLDMMIIHSPQPWVEVNQVLCHISNTPLELMKFCRKNDIAIEAYSQIAHGEILNQPEMA